MHIGYMIQNNFKIKIITSKSYASFLKIGERFLTFPQILRKINVIYPSKLQEKVLLHTSTQQNLFLNYISTT